MVEVRQEVGCHVGAQVDKRLSGIDDVTVRKALVRQAVQQVHADILRRMLGPRQVAAAETQHSADERRLGLHSFKRHQGSIPHAGQCDALPG
jgi:hypothetical protein